MGPRVWGCYFSVGSSRRGLARVTSWHPKVLPCDHLQYIAVAVVVVVCCGCVLCVVVCCGCLLWLCVCGCAVVVFVVVFVR